jgi:hypothetical protein
MANLIVGFPIWRLPSQFLNVAVSEHCTLNSKTFICGKLYYSIIITNFVKLPFPIVGLKMPFLVTLALKSPNKMFIRVYSKFTEYMFQFLIEAVIHTNCILCWCMNIQNNDITRATS